MEIIILFILWRCCIKWENVREALSTLAGIQKRMSPASIREIQKRCYSNWEEEGNVFVFLFGEGKPHEKLPEIAAESQSQFKNLPENTHWASQHWVSQVVQCKKNPPANAGVSGDGGSTPELGRSPGVKNGYPLQYSCLENSMDRRAWWAKSQTQLSMDIHIELLLWAGPTTLWGRS